MSHLFGSSKPPPLPPAPTPPTIADPPVQAAGDAVRANAAAAYGRQSTILTSGQGDTSVAPLAKKTLLGATA